VFETRVATTEQLMEAINAAKQYGFNRYPDIDAVRRDVDPEGFHVFSIIVPFHTRHWPPEGARPDPVHHRVEVLMKPNGKNHPDKFALDITDDMFRMLGSVDEAYAIRNRNNHTEGEPA
jgi:hypothetical protein